MVSLAPLKFEDAFGALLKTPPKKRKSKGRKKPPKAAKARES